MKLMLPINITIIYHSLPSPSIAALFSFKEKYRMYASPAGINICMKYEVFYSVIFFTLLLLLHRHTDLFVDISFCTIQIALNFLSKKVKVLAYLIIALHSIVNYYYYFAIIKKILLLLLYLLLLYILVYHSNTSI